MLVHQIQMRRKERQKVAFVMPGDSIIKMQERSSGFGKWEMIPVFGRHELRQSTMRVKED